MWRFVQISDFHLASPMDGRWNNGVMGTMMPDVMRCLRRDLRELAPEFLLATGDLADSTTRDKVFAGRDFMDWLGCAYYPMGGNHDFATESSRGWFREAYHARLPGGRTYYSFTRHGVHFVVLDAWWMWRDGSLRPGLEGRTRTITSPGEERGRWALPMEQLAWLDAELGVHEAQPAIVACHYPAIAIPDRLRRPGMADAGRLENGDDLISIIRRHANVRAVFSGHLHMNIIEVVEGVTHVVTSALAEYPTEYREVAVHDDRLEVTTRALSDPSFAARSLIEGHEWTAGEAQDRTATIALN
jgi:3',5'-cyclic AMP phosphodiesterase CpdA